MYNFSSLKTKSKEIEEWLVKEFSTLRTGRALPAILDNVVVESYGAKMGIRELASVSVEDVRTLRLIPWDAAQGKNIEKAVANSGLGLSVAMDDKGIRIFFPELTSERRTALVKVAKEKLESARIRLRSARDDVWQDIQNKEREKQISEDDKFRLKNEMQKIVDEANGKLESLYAAKEKEISN
ncbi:MAG: Ribosome-recycling factor [Parcubacteria group bacterium GW2011_GWA2_47_21]|nr:MAG: Ribosome-recycling factor [Parcubacteria group bacterium GW2011_GWA2_47_21]